MRNNARKLLLLGVWFYLSLTLSLFGAGSSEAPQPPLGLASSGVITDPAGPLPPSLGLESGKAVSEKEKVVQLGMVVYADAKAQTARLQPLVDYLSSCSGLNISLKLYDDYFSILNDIDHESLDFALLSPLMYALCMDEPDLTFLATAIEDDKPFYHSVLIARKDSPVQSVKDLAGKKIAFVSKYSTSGYIYPAAFLTAQGLIKDGKPLYAAEFLGSHEKAVKALLEGRVDAAATYETFFTFAKNQVGETKNVALDSFCVLKLLPERIPNDALVCRTALGKEVIGKLQKGLKSFREVRQAANSPLKDLMYTDFLFNNAKAYEDVKKFVENVGGDSAPADGKQSGKTGQ